MMPTNADEPGRPWRLPEVERAARSVPADDVDAALDLAASFDDAVAGLGTGDTWTYLATLATLGSVDLTTARAVEPHLDALAILRQAPLDRSALTAIGVGDASTWGVYAAAGRRLDATLDGDAWTLTGEQPWCSLADRVSHGLIVAETGQGKRLFAIDLHHPGVTAAADPWVGRGLVAVTSGGIRLDAVPAVPVGPVGWYLSRPGFAWGGVGVAAVWFGAAAALRDTLVAAAGRREPDQIAQLHLGRADALVYSALLALRDAAEAIDAGAARDRAGEILAARVRAVVADAAERILELVGHALGPGPLVGDAVHARRVADLTVYLRQHHAERDLARLGALVLDAAESAS